MTAKQASALLKQSGATPKLCRSLPRVALEEAIKSVINGANPRGVVASMIDATK